MNSNIKKQTIFNMLICLMMTGCGAEEESSNKTIEPAPSAPVQESITTSDLVATSDFNFITNVNLAVKLPISPSSSINYFVNICTDFSEENSEITINYGSCKLRTLLKPQEQSFTLLLSTAESKLIAQIWPIEAAAEPINLYWDIAESGKIWQIKL